MKSIRIVLSVALLVLASVAFAQSKPGDLVADVPFAFVAAGHTFSAGHYVVSRLNDTLSIRDRQNQGVFVPALSAQRSTHDNASKMVFHRYGDAYFLAEVWVRGNTIGRELPPSDAERELASRGAEKQIALLRVGGK